MERIENESFRDAIVAVDNTQFNGCTFSNSTLIYGGGALPAFVNCRFLNVDLEFEDAALNTLRFLAGMRRGGGFSQAVSEILDDVRKKKS